MSYANEVVTKAICILRMVNGNLYDALITGVNMGRDTDCETAVSAGICGALTGSSSLPEELIKQTDYATSLHVVSNSRRTIREHSDGLYQAYQSRINKLKAYADKMTAAVSL